MSQRSDFDKDTGLDCYDPEGRVFPKIASRTTNPKLDKRDVLLILKWKLGRIKDAHALTIADHNMTVINAAVSKAVNVGCEAQIEALEALTRVPEIGLAVATAILTVCYPDTFTIIDQRVLESLDLFPVSLPLDKRKEHTSDDWTPTDYIDQYCPKVREYAERSHCTLRTADQILWGLSVNDRIEQLIGMSEASPVGSEG